MDENKITINELIGELKKYINGQHSYNMSTKLKNILEQNNAIEPKEYFIKFFSLLENIIPENLRENFYRNLTTLRIKFDLDYDFSSINEVTREFTGYDIVRNKMEILPSGIKMLFQMAQKQDNPLEFFIEVFEEALFHELLHMASSILNVREEILFTGFSPNILKIKEKKEMKFGLTEGMTEALIIESNPKKAKPYIGYYVEILLVIQLMQIVGRNIMLESYFKNKGTVEIEKELDKFSNGNLNANKLFNDIEENFWKYKDKNKEKQTLLASIQSTLIEYYRNKMMYLIENDLITKEEVENSLSIYEESLIRSEIMKARTGNIEIYLGLDESIEKFRLVKQEIISSLGSNKTKKRTQ